MRTNGQAPLTNVPTSRDAKSEWMKLIARDEEIALAIANHLGFAVAKLDELAPCVLHNDCQAQLTKGGNTEIVYFDPSLEWTKRQFQTLPELAVAIRGGVARKLRPIQQALWRIRLLYECGLIDLPPASVREVEQTAQASVKQARNGFELLVRCRWWLDPGTPVTFTRAFVAIWCEINAEEARLAIDTLRRDGVIAKVGELANGNARPTYLYLPAVGPLQWSESE